MAATLPVSVFLTIEVAAFATQPSVERIEERNLFYLAPLALIALLVVCSRTVRLRRPVLVGSAIVAAALPVTIPFERFITTSAVSDTFALLPWWWVQDHYIALDDLRYAAFACAVAAAALFLFLPRRYWLVLPVLVGAYFVLTTAAVQKGRHGIRIASVGSLWAGIRVTHPDWVDRAVGKNADVTFLWIGRAPVNTVWDSSRRPTGPSACRRELTSHRARPVWDAALATAKVRRRSPGQIGPSKLCSAPSINGAAG